MSEAETVWDWPYLKVMSGHNGWYTFIMMKRVTITEGGRNGLFLLVPPDKSPSLNPPSRHDYHHQACRPPRLPNVGHLSPSRPMAGARWHRVNDGINYVHDTSARRLHGWRSRRLLPRVHARAVAPATIGYDALTTPQTSRYTIIYILPPPWLSGWISGFSQHLFPLYRTLVRKDKSIFFFFFSSCLFAQLFASASVNKSIPEASCYDNLRRCLEHSIHTYPKLSCFRKFGGYMTASAATKCRLTYPGGWRNWGG